MLIGPLILALIIAVIAGIVLSFVTIAEPMRKMAVLIVILICLALIIYAFSPLFGSMMGGRVVR